MSDGGDRIDDGRVARPLPVVENPSTNIQQALYEALEEQLDYIGAYYHAKAYPKAPNPCLRIEPLGRVGLPLSDRDARHLIACTASGPARKIDGSKVVMDNPDWAVFMSEVVQETCSALGVLGHRSHIGLELRKMLLCEPGSGSSGDRTTERSSRAFASVLVILPSEFTGGTIRLRHEPFSASIDVSKSSSISTSVLACFQEVVQDFDAVTSGYRLALLYDLVRPNDAPGLRLPSNGPSIQRIRHVLLSWQQNLAASPSKLVYLLHHRYPEPDSEVRQLRGRDAHVVALLRTLVEDCQFGLRLACLDYHLSGKLIATYRREHSYNSYGESKSESESDEDDDELPKIDEVTERAMALDRLITLDGDGIGGVENTQFPVKESEVVPANMQELLERRVPDDEDYEGDRKKYASRVDKYYRRDVLVIWPQKRENEVLTGEDYDSDMISILNNVDGPQPLREEEEAVHFLSNVPDTSPHRGRILRSVCFAASQWGNKDLWQRTYDNFHGSASFDEIGATGYALAISQLGVEIVLPRILEALNSETTNRSLFAHRQEVETELILLGNPVITASIPSELDVAICSLRPFSPNEGQLFIDLARRNGRVECLHDVIVPQFKLNTPPTPLLQFVGLLRKESVQKGGLLADSADVGLRDDIISDILSWGIGATDFHVKVKKKPAERHSYWSSTPPSPPKPLPDLTQTWLDVCLSAGDSSHVVSLVLKAIRDSGDHLEPEALVKLLETCVSIGKQDSFQDVVQELITPSARNNPASHLGKYLELGHFLDRNHISKTSSPFRSFYQHTTISWLKKYLRPLKESEVRKVSDKISRSFGGTGHRVCCEACRQLQMFFAGNEPSVTINGVGSTSAKHLEQKLMTTARASDIVTWQVMLTTPRGFQVSRKKEVWPEAAADRRGEGLAALDLISKNDKDLQAVFGDNLPEVRRWLTVRKTNEVPYYQPTRNRYGY